MFSINRPTFTNKNIFFYSEKTNWIGLEDPDSDDVYTWIDDSAITYSDWKGGEPKGEVCVTLGKSGWKSEKCSEKAQFVCQRPLGNIFDELLLTVANI